MAVSLATLPRFLVLDPVSTVRFEVHVAGPGGGIDVEPDGPKPDRSFLVLVGPRGGPFARRLRLRGRARIRFPPNGPRDHVVMLANPEREPLVLGLRGLSLRPARAADRSAVPARRPARGLRVPVAPLPAPTRAPGTPGGRLRGAPPKE